MGNENGMLSEELKGEDWLRGCELGFNAFSWFVGMGDRAIRDAAKALWLSNSGGLAVVLGSVVKLEPTGNPLILFLVSLVAYVFGIYWGVDLYVRPAHRLTSFQLKGGEIILSALRNGKGLESIKEDFEPLMLDIKKKSKAITFNLILAKSAFACGASMGVFALVLHFIEVS